MLLAPDRRGALLLQLLCDYSDRFSSMLSGTCDELPTGELAGGARIRAVFLDVFGRAMRELRPLQELSDDEIRTAIANSGGVCGALLVRAAVAPALPALSCPLVLHSLSAALPPPPLQLHLCPWPLDPWP